MNMFFIWTCDQGRRSALAYQRFQEHCGHRDTDAICKIFDRIQRTLLKKSVFVSVNNVRLLFKHDAGNECTKWKHAVSTM